MKTVSIRDLRGTDLLETTRKGKLLGITNRRELIGVVVPVAADWVEHVIDYNLSRVRQSIAEGEQAMAARAPMVTLDDVIAEAGTTAYDQQRSRNAPERPAVPLVAALAGGTLMQAPETRETIRQLQAVLTPPGPAAEQDDRLDEPSVRTVRTGDLSGRLIEQAGNAGQTLAITHDRELIGILIPVTQGLVQFLIEQNMSRVLANIDLAEKQLQTPDPMTTLDQVLGQADSSARAAHRPRP